MSLRNSRTLLLLFCCLWTFTRADHDISCVFMTRCILPCQFRSGPETVIHWIQVSAGDVPVHAFYKDKDQLSRQNDRFRGRTSLFNDEISRGNASLRLTSLQVLDQGRYKCYTSTKPGESKESFINLRVDAPVSKVDVVKVKNVITCSSEEIYPEPELTWSNLTQQHGSTAQQDHLLLYSINSSVTLTDAEDNLDYYSCSVTTRSNSWKTSLFKTTHMNVSDSEYTLTCLSSAVNTKPLSHITWRFNSSEIIAERHGGHDRYKVTSRWDQWVKDVSESGYLTLRDLSADQTGTYTCEVSDARETYINSTFVRIQRDTSHSVAAIVILVVILVAVAVAGIVAGLWYRNKRKKKPNYNPDTKNINEGEEMTRMTK